MPDHDDERHSAARESTISEGTKLPLSLFITAVSLLLVVAGQWFEMKARVTALDFEHRALITATRAEIEKGYVAEDREQEKRITAMEQDLRAIRTMNCAITRKLDVPGDCGRRDDR